jgi:hypothetical protein
MSNVQQPEMRRSGKDPLVQDSVENKAGTIGAGANTGSDAGPVPKDQRSPYGPQPPRERRDPNDDPDDDDAD